jgi:hypothetical protein
LNKSISEISQQTKQLCNELGIQGVNISTELKELPEKLNVTYDEIVKKCQNLEKAFEFYSSYVQYFFQRSEIENI